MEFIDISWSSLFIIFLVTLFLMCSQYLLKIYTIVKRSIRIRRSLRNFPGPKAHWFFGNAREIPEPGSKMEEWGLELTLKYPRYNKFSIFLMNPEVWLRHPEPIKQILKTSEPKPMSFAGGYSLLKPWLGDGLLVSSGAKWHRNRKLLTPGFHFDVLRPYINIYNETADTLISKWEKEGGNGDKTVEIYKSVSLCTLDVMLRCAFSFENDVQSSENKYVQTVNSQAELLWHRGLRPWMLLDALYYRTKSGKTFKANCEYAHKVAYDLIDKRKRQLVDQPEIKEKKYVDFLDILLLARDEQGQGLTLEEIREEVDTFLFEGHDTTASAISWILYALAKHPEHQLRCKEEIDALFTGSSHMEWDDLQKMPYFTQCIKEGLRCFSPVPMVFRELTEPMKIDEHELTPGTQVMINIIGLHHNPTVWGEDHQDFKPERFHPDNMQKMDPHAFIPFSAGPRNCIGQNFAMNEIKVVVARVLRHFEISLEESHPIELLPFVVVRPKFGIKLYLKTLN